MSNISDVAVHNRYDYRGQPSLTLDITLTSGFSGRSFICLDDNNHRDYTREIITDVMAPQLINSPYQSQEKLDTTLVDMDGTRRQKHLGKNILQSFSAATARAVSQEKQTPLYQYLGGCCSTLIPVPMLEIPHEFHVKREKVTCMFLPIGACRFAQAIRWSYALNEKLNEINTKAKKDLTENDFYQMLHTTSQDLGLEPGVDGIFLTYKSSLLSKMTLNGLKSLFWKETKDPTPRVTLGEEKTENARPCCVIAPYHLPTISLMSRNVNNTKRGNFHTIFTPGINAIEDTFLADFAVASHCSLFMFSNDQPQRNINFVNRFLEIEEQLGQSATYAGQEILTPTFYQHI